MTLNLKIVTPYGEYFSGLVEYLSVVTKNGEIGILPEHTPLISILEISKLCFHKEGKEYVFAISGGLIDVEKEQTLVLLRSIESKDDIDIERALQAKKRAAERLKSNDRVDIKRAQASLARALNRINIFGDN
jgi:F-type H+-transporting ATPase subunit epsilon